MTQDTTRAPESGRRANSRSKSRSTASSATPPSPPRARRPTMTALAVLLIVGGAALAGFLALRLDSRVPMVVVGSDVPAGTKITSKMLEQAPVSSDLSTLIKASDADQVVGLYTNVGLSEGQLLDTTMLTEDSPVADGRATVGVPLTEGKVPPNLRPMDEVRLVRIGDGTNPSEALATGLVLSTKAAKANGLAGTSGISVATVLIPQQAADAVVSAAGGDTLGMALLKSGVPVDKASYQVLGGSAR